MNGEASNPTSQQPPAELAEGGGAEHATSSRTLAAALARCQIALPAEQVAALEHYSGLLWDWNERINLTRHTTFDRFAERDIVDALAVADSLAEGERVLDVGSGGGVPGVILAITRPDLKITLIDSVTKKARVLEDVVTQLALPVRVRNEAVQTHLNRHRYDALVVRAVARLDKVLRWLEPHWSMFSRVLMIKGPAWVEERQVARDAGLLKPLHLRRLNSYPLAGTESESVILQISRERPD
ncbi:MAG: 16S rRNA (guanine(527)-N(7))-methyltransferase RsmG [Pirellulales bacterium]